MNTEKPATDTRTLLQTCKSSARSRLYSSL